MTKLFSKFQLSRRQFFKVSAGAVGVGGMGAGLIACSNSGPTYYTLAPYPGKVYLGVASVVEVRTPSLAGFLDKDRIVSELNANQLQLSSGAAWGDTLSVMMGRVMMLNLAQRLPGSNIFLQNQATATKPQIYVEMDVSRFNQDDSGKAIAIVDLSIHRPQFQGIGFHRLLTLQETPKGGSVKELVVALDQLLAQLADIVAQNLVSLSTESLGRE